MADSGQERGSFSGSSSSSTSSQSTVEGSKHEVYLDDMVSEGEDAEPSISSHSHWLKMQLAKKGLMSGMQLCGCRYGYCSDGMDEDDGELSNNGEGLLGDGIEEGLSFSDDSADSQSIFAENEIDKMFQEILIEHSHRSSMSRSLSSSSSEDDFDDDLARQEGFLFQDSHTMHSDWESGLSSNNNSHDNDDWSVALSLFGNLQDLEAIRVRRDRGETEDLAPMYPHRALMYHECEVCLTRSLLRRRVCCDFHICPTCMGTYVAMKVNEAKVQIECPSDRCAVLIHKDEINERLPQDLKEKFARFLINANTDPLKKTCPACSEVYCIEPQLLAVKKKKLKLGLKVQCPQCHLQWCFICQAPFHVEMTCKQFQMGDSMVRKWAKERSGGQSNAQKCPKCKIFIQKIKGCDHMKCTKCNTDFCYRCGDRYISIKLLGNHWSKFSPFGCKYRLMPKRPALRRFIRGANFAARLVAGVVLAGLGLAAGAILVGASVVIVPGYGIFRLRRHLQMRKMLKGSKGRPAVERFSERDITRAIVLPTQTLARLNITPEMEARDARQVQVMVHRSVSFTHEDAESVHRSHDDNYEFYINKYTAEGTDVIVSGKGSNDSDQFIVLSEVTEVQNEGGYPTVVAHIVSKVGPDKEAPAKSRASGRARKESSHSVKVDICENSAGKTDRQVKVHENPKWHKEASECLKTNLMPSADIPSCSWENLSGDGKTISENPASESCKEPSITEGKSVSDDTDSTKQGNNGCFGNIFSKRIQSPVTSVDNPVIIKSQLTKSQKKSPTYKASTWEKCRRDHMQSLLKSSPLDPVKDFNNLTLIMQKPPPLSAEIENIFHNEPKNLKSGFSSMKDIENVSESFIQGRNVFDIISWRASSDSIDEKTENESFGGDTVASSEPGFTKTSKQNMSRSYCPSDKCHISQISEVTYL
ncbi:unnamed protein product [Candidula unifasciata]|uniref:RBR-type E3 ubiquitin transferase n=1 Tax=Candidula unifasciata TaxID=100452 RepID=A0A8S3Z2P7_9EUPU|nr:unnamed protein product [Candidula unifasciata]